MKRNILIAGAASAALITSVAFAQAGGTGADGAAGTPTGVTQGERDTLNTPGSGSMSETTGSGATTGTSGSGMASGSGADMSGQTDGSYGGTSGSGQMSDGAMAAGERG